MHWIVSGQGVSGGRFFPSQIILCASCLQRSFITISQKSLYCIHTLPRGGMYWVVHSRRPRDFSRAEGNLEVGGDVQPNTSRFEAVYGHSLIINPSLGMYQEIHPCRVSSTYSVKINTSLPMMIEWVVHPLRPRDFSYPSRFPAGLAKSLGRWGCTTPYFPPLSNVLVQHISSISGTELQSVDVYTHVLHRHCCWIVLQARGKSV